MRKFIIAIAFIMSAFSASAYSLSNDGKEFIKKYEKCALTAYYDSNGWSIGYGHHGSDVTEGMTITQKQADKFFDNDVKWVEEAANKIIDNLPYKYEFTQGFFDGLCSLIYNAGAAGVKKTDFYDRLCKCRVKNGVMNEEDFNFTIAAVKTARVSCKGHIKRRYAEHIMMLG